MPPEYDGYGIHYPQGVAAVRYIYGDEGTYKQYSELDDVDGYYSGWGGGPYGNQAPTGVDATAQGKLIAYADGTHATTTPDANDHALDKVLPGAHAMFMTPYPASFHEHNGRGLAGAMKGKPFTQFWFDDNWLAREMSRAYGAPPPFGLWSTSDFNRWQILALDTTKWTPYAGNAPDQLALNGLYHLAVNDVPGAMNDWNAILTKAGTAYDSTNQRYSYPGITGEYHLGLFKILTDRILVAGVDNATASTLVQHSISIRSNILSDEQVENGVFIGWLSGSDTDRVDPGSLINTETTACDVLGLGAGAKVSFEVGRTPLVTPPPSASGQFFLRPHNVLSAVVGLSPVGLMSDGPNMPLPTGSYTADFYLRAPAPTGSIALLEVIDATTNMTIPSHDAMASEMATGNVWTRISLPFTSGNGDNIDYRVTWHGNANLDVSTIRIR